MKFKKKVVAIKQYAKELADRATPLNVDYSAKIVARDSQWFYQRCQRMRPADNYARLSSVVPASASGPDTVLRALDRARYLRVFISQRTKLLKTLKTSKWAAQHEIDKLECEIDQARRELYRQEQVAMTFDLVR